ncbi:MAG: BMP family lipoprotein [Armatimonadota bacterium]
MIKLFRGLLLISLIFTIAGCSSNKPTAQTPAETTPSKAKSSIKVAVVTDVGGIGDMSFNAMAWEGLQRASIDFDFDPKILESREQADYAINLNMLADQQYNMVFAVGYMMEDAVKEASTKYPNTKFVIIDGSAPDMPNTASLKFQEEQGSFLAGALAGGMTKTGKIGFIGGIQIPLIQKFECGYRAGALMMRSNIKITTAYCGKFDDPAKGKELALAQFGQGADIIFHAAGGSGRGVIDAAKTKGAGFYAIGVDANQDYLAKGRVLTSMLKRVDNAVYDMCKAEVKGSFKSGVHLYGLKDDGLGLTPMKFTRKDVPAVVLDKIEKIRQMIIDGKIVPPKTPDELKAFKAPKL